MYMAASARDYRLHFAHHFALFDSKNATKNGRMQFDYNKLVSMGFETTF